MSEVFESVFAAIDAFVYRCRNDENYTMEYMAGGVEALLGYVREDIIGNARTSYVGLTVKADVERVFAAVDEAIEAKTPWDVAYRVTHADGRPVWVRERGRAVYEDGEIAYLEGLVVGAEAEFALRARVETMLKESRDANRDIVGLTGKIANSVSQLSMLSVNARIEAARSGHAGRGFAIVANEMKKLAEESGEWAEVIAKTVKSR